MLPAVGASFLPVGTCPACWPAYAGVLGSLGLGFLLSSTYLLPVTAALLGLALASLAFRAKARRAYGPFSLGLVGAALAIAGKFVLSKDPVLLRRPRLHSGRVRLELVAPQGVFRRFLPCVRRAGNRIKPRRTNGRKTMTTKRKIEIFSAGCPACSETISLVDTIACPSCDITVPCSTCATQVLPDERRASEFVPSPPLPSTGSSRSAALVGGRNETTLRDAGLGQPR